MKTVRCRDAINRVSTGIIFYNSYRNAIELDFFVIQRGTRVRVSGYDCHNWLDLTNSVGVVDYYSPATGDYLIYFRDKPGIAKGTRLTLYYRREQLEMIPGKRGKCSWEYVVNKKK